MVTTPDLLPRPEPGQDYCLAVDDVAALVAEYGYSSRDVMMAWASGHPLLSPAGQDLLPLVWQADLLQPTD